jgi:hypothetical protein
MSDEAEVQQQAEKEARAMGWLPKEEFKGDEAHWVEATAFVEKGRQILPIMQKNNERLLGQVGQLHTRLDTLTGALKAAQTTIETLEASHADDVKEQVEQARKDLKAELTVASRDGDHEAVAEITDKLGQLNAANRDAGGEEDPSKGKPPPTERPVISPEVQAWFQKNQDFVSNPRKVALAGVIQQELRAAGETAIGAAFLDLVAEKVEAEYGGRPGGTTKVSAGNGGGSRETASSASDKTYADLPADAKLACDKFAAKVVGPSRKHKDVASWRASYTEQYFKE